MSIALEVSKAALNNILIWATRLLNDSGMNQDDFDAVTILDQMGDDPDVVNWTNSVVNFLQMIIYVLNTEIEEEEVLDDSV